MNVYVNVTGVTILFIHVASPWEFQIRQSQINERGFSYITQSKNTTDREVKITREWKWISDRNIRSFV